LVALAVAWSIGVPMRITVSSNRKAARRVGKPEISSVMTKRTRRLRHTSEERFCAVQLATPDLANAWMKADIPYKPFRSRKFQTWAHVHHMSKRRNISPKARQSPKPKRSAARLSPTPNDPIPSAMAIGN
jgi:hypothetical protein